ncbi:hypothetical protein BS78_02G179500 [Paspalum vaginatum]|nr:hypothetical protein BS78_02G179500 [Paspalum vaginatum]
MASGATLKMAAALTLVLFAGQLLAAAPAAAEDGRLLQGLVKRRSLQQTQCFAFPDCPQCQTP